MARETQRVKAIQMLVLANLFWGLSFPTTKALAMTQQSLLPAASSWFIASLCVVYRFAAAALILLLLSARTLKQTTCLELEQGLGPGVFSGIGNLPQVGGSASTSPRTSPCLAPCVGRA